MADAALSPPADDFADLFSDSQLIRLLASTRVGSPSTRRQSDINPYLTRRR
jgi:hypothetical protein